jgi:hypothetical protein
MLILGTLELTLRSVSSSVLAVELIHRTLDSTLGTFDGTVKTVVVQLPSVSRLGPSIAVTVASIAGNLAIVSAKGPLVVQCPSSNFSRIEALT